MPLEQLLTQLGYPAMAVGTIMEGEAALIIGGFMAKQGYLTLSKVMAVAFCITLASDQFFFHLGRWQGAKVLAKRPKWKEKTARILRLVHTNHIWVSIFFRFVYGLRTVTPFTLGLSGIPPLRFLGLNLIGICLWVGSLASLGFIFGHAFQEFIKNVEHYELWIAGMAILGLLLAWVFKLLWQYWIRHLAVKQKVKNSLKLFADLCT